MFFHKLIQGHSKRSLDFHLRADHEASPLASSFLRCEIGSCEVAHKLVSQLLGHPDKPLFSIAKRQAICQMCCSGTCDMKRTCGTSIQERYPYDGSCSMLFHLFDFLCSCSRIACVWAFVDSSVPLSHEQGFDRSHKGRVPARSIAAHTCCSAHHISSPLKVQCSLPERRMERRTGDIK